MKCTYPRRNEGNPGSRLLRPRERTGGAIPPRLSHLPERRRQPEAQGEVVRTERRVQQGVAWVEPERPWRVMGCRDGADDRQSRPTGGGGRTEGDRRPTAKAGQD